MLCFIGLELYLRYGFYRGGANYQFVTHQDKSLNEEINQENRANSKKHPHGFNDAVRPMEKAPGVYRVAVLGDSFVWGDGVPYEQIWSHKLERLLLTAHPGKVEVLSWGLRGWSTLDEYTFLKQHGINYHIDLVIVGFVTNDPDMGLYKQRYFRIHDVSGFGPLRKILPNAVDFIGERTESLISKLFDLGYGNWEQKLYRLEIFRQISSIIN